MEDKCVSCGGYVPEGSLVCKTCMENATSIESDKTYSVVSVESPYISAAGARNLMRESLKKYVESRIKIACEKGEFSVQVPLKGTFSADVIVDIMNTFIQLGYHVTKDATNKHNKEILITFNWAE